MAKRFSRYKFALKANNGTTETGSALDKYKKYQTGETKPTYTRSDTSNPGGLAVLYVCPFAAAVGAIYLTYISKRAQTNLGTVSDNATTVFNHITPAGGDTPIENPMFLPAKAIVNMSGTGTTTETSKITGLTYKKESDSKSYTIPFGSKKARVADDTLLAQIAIINTAVKAKSAESIVSFQPEKFKG